MSLVLAETRGAVGLAQLNRPDARNALSPELMEELASICERWDEDPDVRCIVITGGDEWFAAGADDPEPAHAMALIPVRALPMISRWICDVPS